MTHPDFSPLLGTPIHRVLEKYQIQFPVLATPKLDGVRALTCPGNVDTYGSSVAMARSLKPIPNRHVQYVLGQMYPGLDGEIIAVDPKTGLSRSFHETQSRVMTIEGVFEFRFWAFDYCRDAMERPSHRTWHNRGYAERCKDLELVAYSNIRQFQRLLPVPIYDARDLDVFEAKCILDGYEGICFRTPTSPYKFGRSTPKEQYLVKVKRFLDSEAVVIGAEEARQNLNAAETSPLGYQVRATHQSLMRPKGILGALIVKSPSGVEFGIGTGFNHQQRVDFWRMREQLIGKTVKYKHQPHGAKDRPRIPVFIGFRDALDMSQPELPSTAQTQDDLPM